MEASSSSKITVEYHDPSGVFPLVSRDIAARLPLRNLNWQSPSRPLRQIKHLHVEFVADKFTQNTLRPPVLRTDSDGPNSFDIVRSGRDQRKDGAKERRHQIPGLKTSPYLKIYVLRCDDKDTYKETERKRIREWINEYAQNDGKREKHEAFEWLILHVVIPDTVAASEPRWREATASKDADEMKERPKGSKWPGKKPKTVFDRLRKDFNESGKTGQDHVAQIRLLKSDVPSDLLPTPAVAQTLEETPQERDNAWKDLIDKLKVLILAPFDARVRQYEADIAAQESRRSLPGWNFCTFFIHKEGLAMALESIGLVEDALVIYDELSLGLESVVRDMASGKAEGTATTFATYTEDIEARILGKNKHVANGATTHDTSSSDGNTRSDLFSQDYRAKIVTSTISVFDFFCYVFTRQKALILRLANTRASRTELGTSSKDGGEDIVLISEVCWRAASFLHNNARTLRKDLESRPTTASEVDIEGLVSSWTYAVAEQVLSETAASVLGPVQQPDRSKPPSNGTLNSKRPDFSFGMGANPYPERSSSLAVRRSAPELNRPPSRAITESTLSPPSSAGTDGTTKMMVPTGIPGLPELATYRAELLMLQRKCLETIARGRGWRMGLMLARQGKQKLLEDVDLDAEDHDDASSKKEDATSSTQPGMRILSPLLASALKSEDAFQTAYEELSEQAMHLFAQATQTKSVEAIIADFGILKSRQGDYATAAEYFKNILANYTSGSWSVVEAELLSSYAKCLRELEQKDEYVTTILDILVKVCERKTTRKLLRLQPGKKLVALDEEDVFDSHGLLSELISYSAGLATERKIPMDQFFTTINLEHEVMHHEDRDGFALRLTFHHILDDEVEVDQISARLVSVDDPGQEVWLVSDGTVKLSTGFIELDLETTVVGFGTFVVDKIVLSAKKLRFVHEFKPMRPELKTPLGILEPEAPSIRSVADDQPRVLLYPGMNAFSAEISVSKSIHINKPRHLEIALDSGWNEISGIDLRLKPFSAGLRLHLADATSEGISHLDEEKVKLGQIRLGNVDAHNSALVKVPYTVEQPVTDVAVRLEARYHTPFGTFTFLASARHPHELPLDVEVKDLFQSDTLLSNFTVRTTNSDPVYLTSVRLDDSPVFSVEAPPVYGMPIPIFKNQPSNLIYKISPKPESDSEAGRRDAALALHFEYQSAAELIIATMESRFEAQLQQSHFWGLHRLLLPILSYRCNQFFSKVSLELAIILGEQPTPSYEELGWQEVVATLPQGVHQEVSEWLKKWHKDHSHVSFGDVKVAEQVTRSITISVDVPILDVVHNASLAIQAPKHESGFAVEILTMGKPVTADLSIACTEAWSAQTVLGGSRGGRASPSSFIYDVVAEPDTWLIGGQRRGHFQPNSNEPFKTVLTLVPLKVGTLAFPMVEVHPEPDGAGTRDGRSVTGEPAASSETYYENAGETVEVIWDRRVVEVLVPDPERPASVASVAIAPGKQPSRPNAGLRSVTEPG